MKDLLANDVAVCGSESPSRVAALVLAAASALTVGVPLQAHAEDVLRASPLGPPGHLLNSEVLAGWAAAVGKATGGRVRVEILPRAVAPPPQLLGAIRDGAADVSIMSNGASATPLPLNGLVEFAGQTPSAERASVAYQHVVKRYPMLVDEFSGVEVLAVFTHGPGAMLLSEPGTAATGDLQAATLHAGGAGAAAAVRAVGAKVSMAPGPESKALLVERRVGGTITALETLDSFGLASNIKEIVLIPGGFYCAGFSLIANNARWAALAPDDRAAILGVSGEVLARSAGRAWDGADAEALRSAKAGGIAVVDAPAALVERVESASRAREQAWIGAVPPEARNALAAYRDELRGTASTVVGR